MLFFLLVSTSTLWATSPGRLLEADQSPQGSIEVTGIVVSETGEEMPGVSVIIKGTSTGTITNLDGKYRITVPSDNTVLQFSFIGYKTVEETVNHRKIINVKF